MKHTNFVWELHTRLFHWGLVILFTAAMITGLLGEMDWMEWHVWIGYGLLGLMIFRLLIGIVGRDYSHFSHFALSPKKVIDYLRGNSEHHYLGHNPAGSWMVIFMLLAITLQALSGLLTTDDFFVEGPWVYWFEEKWVSLAGNIHHFNWQILLGLAAMHLLAIVYYQLVKKESLARAMLTGHKTHKAENPPTSVAVRLPLWLQMLLMALAAGFTWCVIELPAWL